jgi:hypothetical protein
MKNQVVIKKDEPISMESIILRAIEKNTPVDVMERLLAMRMELKKEFAREQYYVSLAKFQSEIPPIKKTKKCMNRDGVTVRYCYAPIEDIIDQVKDALNYNGFSCTFDTKPIKKDSKDYLAVFCFSHHTAGHSETTSIEIPLGEAKFMTDQQEVGSASSYGKRYAFCNAFRIMTEDEDNDANEIKVEKKEEPSPVINLTPEDKKIFDDYYAVLTIPQKKELAETFGIKSKTDFYNKVPIGHIKATMPKTQEEIDEKH